MVSFGNSRIDIEQRTIDTVILGGTLDKLTLPPEFKMVRCSGNNLTELDIPSNYTTVICWGNNIKELYVPETLRILYCDKGVELKGDLGNLRTLILC